MKYRKLDSNGDYTFGNNNADYVTDLDAVVQAIRTKILLFYGEWWEDIGIGIPMFQSLIGQVNPEGLKQSATLLLTKRIQELNEVTSVNNIDLKIEKRTISFSADVDTVYGQASVEVIT